jgi:hypothetical protein
MLSESGSNNGELFDAIDVACGKPEDKRMLQRFTPHTGFTQEKCCNVRRCGGKSKKMRFRTPIFPQVFGLGLAGAEIPLGAEVLSSTKHIGAHRRSVRHV